MRKNWNNYTVQYKHNNEIKFGNIIKIYDYSDSIYCVINKLILHKANIFSKFSVNDVVEAMQAFDDYFFSYDISTDYEIVKIDSIINKCIPYEIIASEKRIAMLTPCVSVEHD